MGSDKTARFEELNVARLAVTCGLLAVAVACGKSGGQRPNPGTPPAGSNQPQAGSAPQPAQPAQASITNGGANARSPQPDGSSATQPTETVGEVPLQFTQCEEKPGQEKECVEVSIDSTGRRTERALNAGLNSRTAQMRSSALNQSQHYGAGQTAVFAQGMGATIEQIYSIRQAQSTANPQLATYLESDIKDSSRPAFPLFYSGAASDELRSHVQNQWSIEQAQAPAPLQSAMVEFAKSIDDVRLVFAKNESVAGSAVGVDSVQMIANLKSPNGQLAVIVLQGKRVSESNVSDSTPRPIRFDLPATPDSVGISARVYCVDMTPGCSNAVVRLRQTQKQADAQKAGPQAQAAAVGQNSPAQNQTLARHAYVVVRSSPVDLYFEGSNQPVVESNRGYRTLLSGLMNASSRSPLYPRIARVATTSSETIGGSAQIRTLMVIESLDAQNQVREEAIEVAGPLVRPKSSDTLFVSLGGPRRATEVEVNPLVETQVGGLSNLTLHSVKGVALIRNNGFGSFGLSLEFPRSARADQRQSADQLQLHMRRAVLNVMLPNQFE